MTAKAAERQLTELSGALDLAKKKEASLVREVRHLQLEKDERETVLSMEVQAAEERISTLRAEANRVAGLEGQVAQLMEEREERQATVKESQDRLQARLERITDLETQLDALLSQGTASSAQLSQERNMQAKERVNQLEERRKLEGRFVEERQNWEREKQDLELSRAEDLARLEGELAERQDEMEEAADVLTSIVKAQNFSVSPLPTNVMKLSQMLENLFGDLTRRVQKLQDSKDALQEEVKNGDDAIVTANQTIAALNQENTVLQQQVLDLESKLKVSYFSVASLIKCLTFDPLLG
jgi:chromosome segregation ATPase